MADDKPRPDNWFFQARLTPHRSLTPEGFSMLMLAVGMVSFVGGIFFVLKGLWPVAGFFGLDAALLYVALRRNFQDARAYEEVWLSPDSLLLRRVGRRGEIAELTFNPYWVRLDVLRIEDEGVTRLELSSHGARHPVGAFLNPDDRESFAEALSRALSVARTGGPLAAGA
ncbi:hypothetical protein HDIA_0613 [Hartmannibacter diazotrophicus]|uniref:Integral membrane protein n=1 Tax=Hartmannibacter diazotrophicus TaxID=1482074 RepID=A0A2C9D1Q1_9HYPH|nr:DUF2244 domain-containing protein [Hartmannibacter diazotrophicus]SON54154.1 hypothetical protein HDIA_0613 [Hartmannibacter diazotrophicus]